MAKLDSLVVDLQVETASLRQGLEKASELVKGFGANLKSIGDGITRLGELAAVELGKRLVESLAEFVVQGAEAADRMGKLASAAQVPVETFERLSYAAKLGGVSTEELGGAFNKLNKALGQAATGSQAQVDLFRALGVSLKDGSGRARESADVFKELATKLDGMAPGYAKATLEQELFGKSGTQLDATLHNVADGLADAGGEADKFGLVLSGDAIKAASEFHDNVEKIQTAVAGVGERVAAQLAPALAELTDELLRSKAGAELLTGAVDALVIACRIVITAVVATVEAMHLFNEAAELVGAGLLALASGDLTSFAAIAKTGTAMLSDELADFGKRVKAIWSDSSDSFADAGKAHKTMADGILADMERMKNASARMEERFKEAKHLAETLSKEHFVDVEASVKNAKITESGVTAQERFANVGRPSADVAKEATKGFADFQDAIDQYTQAQIGINNEQAEANKAKASLDVEGFDFAMDALRNQEEIADRSRKAVDGFSELANIQVQQMAQTKAAIGGAVLDLAERFGDLGSVIGAAAKGFQSGGVWGALIAAVVELLSKFTRFKEVMDAGNAVVQDLLASMGPGLSAVVDGLKSLLNGLGPFVAAIGSLLNGPLRGVGIMFDHLGRTFAQLSDGLGPAMDAIGTILDVVMELISVLDPMKPIITVLGAIFKIVGIALLELNRGLMMFVGWVLDAIRNFLLYFPQTKEIEALEYKLSELTVKMNYAADAAGQKAEKMWQELGHQFDDPFGLDSAAATTARGKVVDDSAILGDAFDLLAKASGGAASALDKLNSSLTNVPTGFRYNAAAYAATADSGMMPGIKGDVHVHVGGGVMTTVDNLVQLLKVGMRDDVFRRTGKAGP